MILCLDIGNTQILGGVFDDDTLKFTFRLATKIGDSSDQYGIFLKGLLLEHDVKKENIHDIAICSVVPPVEYSIRSTCIKYFSQDPLFLQAGVKTGLKIKYSNPLEVGADRIANAIAAMLEFANRNIIIVDFGTATTFCTLNDKKEYLGGVILPGMKLSMKSLQSNTAKLSSVEIIKPDSLVGKTTASSIQSGIYYSQLATVQYMTKKITSDLFHDNKPVIIGTGGFSHLFSQEGIFDVIQSDLVLYGLKHLLTLNSKNRRKGTKYGS